MSDCIFCNGSGRIDRDGEGYENNCVYCDGTGEHDYSDEALRYKFALEEIRETYIGLEITKPTTAPEAYWLQEMNRMYKIAVEALK